MKINARRAAVWAGRARSAFGILALNGAALPPTATECSPNDTTVPPASGIVDANGDTWTIINGQAVKDGQAQAANAVELAWVIPLVWREDSAGTWYSWGGTTWSAGTTTSPLPAVPSPDNTVITAPTTAAIIDTTGNAWTITPGGQVAENGKVLAGTANVIVMAWEKGVVWQENTANNWYSIIPFSGPTKTSPIPPTPTPPPPPPPPSPTTASPDKTVVIAGQAGIITDSLGNAWTISSGQVLENGKAPAFSSNVSQIAYVGGIIYQANNSNQWYSWTNGAWTGGPNPFTSTCAYNPALGQITCTVIP